MNYESFSPEAFVFDEAFRRWVKQPTTADDAFWTQFLAQHPEKAPDLEQARRLVMALRVTNAPLSEADIQGALLAIRAAALQENSVRSGRVLEHPANRPNWLGAASVFRAAAMLAVVVGVSLWLYLGQRPLRYETAYGETRHVDLPDGSTVVLNAHSTLRMNRWEAGQAREVWLEGEGFFEVKHQPDHARFTVHTADLAVEVLGTTFNVTKRRSKTRVVLNTGRIAIHLNKQPDAAAIQMKPGDLVEVTNAKASTVRRAEHVRADDYSAWQRNRLVFNNTPVSEIAQLIEDSYGISVQFADSTLANRRLSGTLPSNNRHALINSLAALLDATIIEENGHLRVSPN